MDQRKVVYREHVAPPLPWWIIIGAIALTMATILWVPFGGPGAIGGAAVTVVAVAVWYTRTGRLAITVDNEGLTVGKARIERSAIGTVEALDPAEWRAVMGPQSPARPWLNTRAWCKRGVKINVVDPRDPHDCWLVSSNHPEDIVRTLGNSRQDSRQQADRGDQ